MQYSGETHIDEGTLRFQGNLNTPGGDIFVGASGSLRASGLVQRTVRGQGPIVADGTLFLGNTTDGYVHQGSLVVGSHLVGLLDPDASPLASATINGGTLSTLTTTELAGSLVGFGTVAGRFVNHGMVIGGSGADILDFTGTVSGDGSFAGNVRFSGAFSPGNSPAAVSLENVAFGGASKLIIEIGGGMPGAEHDQVVVSEAALSGTLQVATINDFAPSGPGESFEILTYGARTGVFNEVTGQPSTALSGLFWIVSYTPTSVILSTSALPGDIDLDGEVDRTDAALFSQYFGRETGSIWTTGDFDGDGETSVADWGLLQSHLGQSVPSPSAAAVPEPSSLLIAAMALVLAACRLLRVM
jgi:hypothetical protein